VQDTSFETVEKKLTMILKEVDTYYQRNYLRPNPAKIQICSFHLNNRESNHKLNIIWDDIEIDNAQHPKYLGVTLDRSLTYRAHYEKLKKKIASRNGLLQKLTGNCWEAQPHTLRTTAMALCLSTAKYASPLWGRSTHSKQIDVTLNDT
jgi:hypothetical protein